MLVVIGIYQVGKSFHLCAAVAAACLFKRTGYEEACANIRNMVKLRLQFLRKVEAPSDSETAHGFQSSFNNWCSLQEY